MNVEAKTVDDSRMDQNSRRFANRKSNLPVFTRFSYFHKYKFNLIPILSRFTEQKRCLTNL